MSIRITSLHPLFHFVVLQASFLTLTLPFFVCLPHLLFVNLYCRLARLSLLMALSLDTDDGALAATIFTYGRLDLLLGAFPV